MNLWHLLRPRWPPQCPCGRIAPSPPLNSGCWSIPRSWRFHRTRIQWVKTLYSQQFFTWVNFINGCSQIFSQYSKHLFVHIGQTNPSYSDPLLEAVDIRQIYDKFPEKKGGLKELYEKGPQNAFFLVKFWVSWIYFVGYKVWWYHLTYMSVLKSFSAQSTTQLWVYFSVHFSGGSE